MMRAFIKLVESVTYPEVISVDDLSRMVAEIHHQPQDFDEGDLQHRLNKFDQYVLMTVPVSSLKSHEWNVDDDMVADYADQSEGTSPPIVYDSMAKSIIDGTHRVNAAIQRGNETIVAYVGLAKYSDPDWEEHLEEKYTQDNVYLRNYLKGKEFDPHAHWWEVCNWIEENGYSDLIIGDNPMYSDLQDQDPQEFYKLPPEVQKECAEYVVGAVLQNDPAEAPTWAHLDIRNRNKMLPRTSWLVHFTNNPYEISKEGFTRGVDQMDKLGLTTWLSDQDKKYGGYNFAFEATSRYADYAASVRKYGKHAVLFQNSGIKAHHHGDEEDQIIFWGKDVDPKNIIVLTEEDGNWVVHSKRSLRNGETTLHSGDFQACVNWVIQNYQQYRRWLS